MCIRDSRRAALGVTREVDDGIAAAEHQRALLDLQARFLGDVDVFRRERRLVFEGELFKLGGTNKTGRGAQQLEPRAVHLLSDVLLYSKAKANGRLQFRRQVALAGAKVEPRANSEYAVHIFAIVEESGHVSVFSAHNARAKHEWMARVDAQIVEATLKAAGEADAGAAGAGAAAAAPADAAARLSLIHI